MNIHVTIEPTLHLQIHGSAEPLRKALKADDRKRYPALMIDGVRWTPFQVDAVENSGVLIVDLVCRMPVSGDRMSWIRIR